MTVEITETKFEKFELPNEEQIEQNIRSLLVCMQFRTAWDYLVNNNAQTHYRFYAMGIALQQLANYYANINLEECLLRKELEATVQRLLSML